GHREHICSIDQVLDSNPNGGAKVEVEQAGSIRAENSSIGACVGINISAPDGVPNLQTVLGRLMRKVTSVRTHRFEAREARLPFDGAADKVVPNYILRARHI